MTRDGANDGESIIYLCDERFSRFVCDVCSFNYVHHYFRRGGVSKASKTVEREIFVLLRVKFLSIGYTFCDGFAGGTK